MALFAGLSLARRFGRDAPASHQLHVVARDDGMPPLSSTQSLTVTVRPVHSAAPRFTQSTYSLNVTENQPQGTILARLTATHAMGELVSLVMDLS